MNFDENAAPSTATEGQDAMTPPVAAEAAWGGADPGGEALGDGSGYAAWLPADEAALFAQMPAWASGETESPDTDFAEALSGPPASGFCDSDEAAQDASLSATGAADDAPDAVAAEQSGEEAEAPRLLGLRFRKSGQVFFFPGNGLSVRVGSMVVVQLEQGPALGEVRSLLPMSLASAVDPDQMPGTVLRKATAEDIAQHAENSILTAEATAFCKSCIRQRGLDMKLVDVEVMHDRGKIVFYFTAPSRIDFRELVKDLVRNYRTRIELRQIGVRHEAQMIGAIGNCGMVCCCHSYLRKFAPVTIKMAKEQNLFLNPSKLSGMCGRLLCCLSFEQGNYEEFNRSCPKPGKRYTTTRGLFKVLRTNLFNRSISLLNENNEEVEMPLEEWDSLEARRAEPAPQDQPRSAQGREHSRRERPGKRGNDSRQGSRPARHREEPEKE